MGSSQSSKYVRLPDIEAIADDAGADDSDAVAAEATDSDTQTTTTIEEEERPQITIGTESSDDSCLEFIRQHKTIMVIVLIIIACSIIYLVAGNTFTIGSIKNGQVIVSKRKKQ